MYRISYLSILHCRMQCRRVWKAILGDCHAMSHLISLGGIQWAFK